MLCGDLTVIVVIMLSRLAIVFPYGDLAITLLIMLLRLVVAGLIVALCCAIASGMLKVFDGMLSAIC